MSSRKWNKPTIVLLVLSVILAYAPAVYTNAALLPSITIMVNFPPEDLSLSIIFPNEILKNAIKLGKNQRAWEAYFRMYHDMVPLQKWSLEGATLVVQSSEVNFELPFPESVYGTYTSIFTLDIANERIVPSQTLQRLFVLASLRVLSTLLIEGLIFLAFGYRKKSSWITFIVINLITQSALNLSFNGPNLYYYWILLFLQYELMVFATEMIAFPFILKEQKKSKAVLYAFCSNFSSLVLGCIMLSILPV